MKNFLLILPVMMSLNVHAAEMNVFSDKDGNTLITNVVSADGKANGISDDGTDLSKYDTLKKRTTYSDTPKIVEEKIFDQKKPCVNRAETEILGRLGAIQAESDYRLCLISKAGSKRGITNRKEIRDYKQMVWEMNH